MKARLKTKIKSRGASDDPYHMLRFTRSNGYEVTTLAHDDDLIGYLRDSERVKLRVDVIKTMSRTTHIKLPSGVQCHVSNKLLEIEE